MIDGRGMEAECCECGRATKREYDRLLGSPSSSTQALVEAQGKHQADDEFVLLLGTGPRSSFLPARVVAATAPTCMTELESATLGGGSAPIDSPMRVPKTRAFDCSAHLELLETASAQKNADSGGSAGKQARRSPQSTFQRKVWLTYSSRRINAWRSRISQFS